MRGTKAKRIRKSMPAMEPGYQVLAGGQIISKKRMAYQKAKKSS